ncbi:hypothetical protein Hdeb2414_s0021g00570081 [Helianthus debilis subsp. tardiflorus]
MVQASGQLSVSLRLVLCLVRSRQSMFDVVPVRVWFCLVGSITVGSVYNRIWLGFPVKQSIVGSNLVNDGQTRSRSSLTMGSGHRVKHEA